MFKKISFSLIIVLILISSIFAFGVSPGKIYIDFKPNMSYSFEMSVVNSPAKDQDAEITTDLFELNRSIIEEFRDIITLDKTRLSFTRNDAEKKVIVDLKFPEGFSQGGVHELRVGARPYVDKTSGMGMIAENAIRILINVPNEYVSEKYRIIKKLKILSVNSKPIKKGEKAEIDVLVKSESGIVLKEVYAKVGLFSGGSELANIGSNKFDINPGEEKTLKILADTASFNAGDLNLNIEVFYGDESTKGNGILSITGAEEGFQLEKKKLSTTTILIIVFFTFFILIIILLLFLLLRKKKGENSEGQYVQQQYV